MFFSRLRADGIPVELESNGVIMPEADKGNYPVIQHDESIWKNWYSYATVYWLRWPCFWAW